MGLVANALKNLQPFEKTIAKQASAEKELSFIISAVQILRKYLGKRNTDGVQTLKSQLRKSLERGFLSVFCHLHHSSKNLTLTALLNPRCKSQF